MYRYILRESCSQFDSLPLTSLTISYTISNQVLTRALLGCVLSATRCPALRHALELGAEAEARAHVAVRDAAARDAALSGEYLDASRAESFAARRGDIASAVASFHSERSRSAASVGFAPVGAGGGAEAEGGAADAALSAELIGAEIAAAAAAAAATVGMDARSDDGDDEDASAAPRLRSGAALGARFGSQTARGCGCGRGRCRCSWSAAGVAAAAAWFTASTSLFALAWIIANGLPFFAELTGVLGAISHTPIGLLFPALFTLAVAHGAGRTVESPRENRIVGCAQYALCVAIVVFSTVLMCVGFVANVRSAVLKAGDEGLPFACHCRAEECAVPPQP